MTARRPHLVAAIYLAALAVVAATLRIVPALATPTPPCANDAAGHLVQVAYLAPEGRGPGIDPLTRRSITAAVAEADAYLTGSGPGHHIRWRCIGDALDIAAVAAPPMREDLAVTFDDLVQAAAAAGHDRADRLYVLFYPANAGYAEVGEALGSGDASQGPQYALVVEWSGFWTRHELGHALGAVPASAPHQYERGHCLQLHDVMCRRLEDKDDPRYDHLVVWTCPHGPVWYFDCNHDDYCLHGGDWWDVADSPYLSAPAR